MKNRKYLVIALLIILIFSSLGTVYAGYGERLTPYSAFVSHKFSFREYSWEEPRNIELKLNSITTGEPANKIIQQENMYNDKPASDEQWVLMEFDLKYISGPEEPLYAYEVITDLYTNSGARISPVASASFSNEREGLDPYDVQLYPGSGSKVWYGVLIKKSFAYPLMRIPTGYDNKNDKSIYSWFSTDPSYKEVVLRFKDVPQNHWAYNSIENLASKNIINGYEDGSFKPNNNLTRAQAASMIVKAAGIDYKGKVSDFVDVPSTNWASAYIAAAKDAGILNGYGDRFKPNDNVTRAQIAVMISKAFDLKNTGADINFKDVPDSHWANKYVEILASNNIVSGYEDNTFKPNNQTTRAQFAKILSNAMEK